MFDITTEAGSANVVYQKKRTDERVKFESGMLRDR
jgi:hypothetical protein